MSETIQLIIVAVVVAIAIFITLRGLIRVLYGKRPTCPSCTKAPDCPFCHPNKKSCPVKKTTSK